MTPISKVDFVAVPSQDAERAHRFYTETLGLRPDDNARHDFWIGSTCFVIWEPEKLGLEFVAQKNAHVALYADDVAAAKAELESRGVVFDHDVFDTGVCHMALFSDPDGNVMMLHNRYKPYD